MYSPTRTRSSSTTPILQNHRGSKPGDSAADVGIMIEDNRQDDSIELQSMRAVPARARAAGRNGPGLAYDATMESKLVRSRRKLELASFRLNQVHAAGGNVAQLTTNLNRLIEELSNFVSIADPAQLLDDVMSPATIRARAAYFKELGEFEAAVRAGSAKHAWNLAAGGAGNAIAFGIGGIVSTATGNPWLGLPVNTLLWTFVEPLVSMLRATTCTNPYLDLYMVRQRLQARAAREALDGTAGLERNRKFAWTNADSGKTEWLNAADWLSRTSWLTLWSGKHLTDDVPCYLYTLAYGATNSLPEFAPAALFGSVDTARWMRMGFRTGAGVLTGAALQECVQLLRASQLDKTGGRETVTKTTALWQKEAAVVRLVLDDIDARRNAADLTPQQKQGYAMLHRSFTLWQRKAVAKSAMLSSIGYEWSAMLQPKREAIGIDPEVPGKRLYTAASFIGKGLSQLPGLATAQMAAEVVKSPVAWMRWVGYVVPPFAMIGAAGFIARRELEVLAHTMLSAAHGVARRCCGGHEAED